MDVICVYSYRGFLGGAHAHAADIQGRNHRGKVEGEKGSFIYRASQVLVDLGWIDLDLGSSPGWWAGTVATYCPSRPGELPKCLSSKACE